MLGRVFGLLNIRKPPGPTSHDIVDSLRRRIGRGVKLGHAGTLDPFAEGVLVICLGPATRLADYVQAQPKRYVATVTLGATSDTDDPTGQITTVQNAQPPPREQVQKAMGRFLGPIEQVPPAYSAVHVAGQRAYKLTRGGKRPDLTPRTVTVHAIELLAYTYPALKLAVVCSSGTYLRALARDIGAALSCGGYCGALVRTAVGPFTLDQAVAPEQVDLPRDLLPAVMALGEMPRLTLPAAACAQLATGQAVKLSSKQLAGPIAGAAELAALDEQGRLVAICTLGADGRTLRPGKVFIPR